MTRLLHLEAYEGILPLIKDHLCKIPGNGSLINIWKNQILDLTPLGENPSLCYMMFFPKVEWNFCLKFLSGILLVIGRAERWITY